MVFWRLLVGRHSIYFAIGFLFAALTLVLPAQARQFIDSAGRSVEVPDHIGKVLAAGPPASILIYTLAPEKLAGWVRAPSEQEKPYLKPEVRDLPAYGRLTGKGGTANLEAVLAARPDVIIDVGTIDDTYRSLADKVQKQTGIPYILMDGKFAKTADTLTILGELLGVEARAGQLADYTRHIETELQDGLKTIPTHERPKVYYGRGPKGLETGLAGSINMEILQAAGAVNVAAAAGEGGLTQVSPEQVLAWNPQIILTNSVPFIDAVKTDQRWRNVEAVEKNRVYFTPTIPFGWFDAPPGVNRLIGIRWLQKLFYPDRFTNDLRQDVQEFYRLFYQVELEPRQIDALLSQALPDQ